MVLKRADLLEQGSSFSVEDQTFGHVSGFQTESLGPLVGAPHAPPPNVSRGRCNIASGIEGC